MRYSETKYRTIQRKPAATQRNLAAVGPLDPNKAVSFPRNSPSGERSWLGDKLIDEQSHCRLPTREYGLLLFERDLAERNLRVANYRLSNERQKQRNQGTMATTDQQNNTEHVHEEPIQSSPRLSSKLPLDHRSSGEDGTRVHSHLNGYAHHQDNVSQDSNSENEDKHGHEAANNYTSSSNVDDDRGGGDDDNNDDYDVISNDEGSSEKDGDVVNDDDNDENCDENCEIEYLNNHESNNNYDDEENFASNNGVCAESCNIQAPLCPKEDETFVESDETDESLTEELNASLLCNSQYSIGEDTGNSSAENNDGSVASSSSNNDSSCENSKTRSDKKKTAKKEDLQKPSSYRVGNISELSVKRDSEATSQGARPKILEKNPVFFNAFETNCHNGKIPSLETTGINQNFLARHSTDPSLPQSSFAETYDMPPSNKNSNDWTQHSISSNSSSSSLWNLHRSPAPERSGLMLENAYFRGLSSWYRDPMPVNYQAVTPITGQIPSASGFSRDVDSFNWDENLPSNKHQTGFSSFEDFSIGNETQTASPLLGVRPLAPAVRYPAVTAPNFPNNTWQFSSSTTSGSVAPATSTYDVFSSHEQECVGDFNRYRPSQGDTQANSGLTSSEMVHSERREESLRSHGPFNYQQEGSCASVSLRDPSLVSLEQQVAEIDRVLKEREERTKKQREAAQRLRDTREKRQREARKRKEREETERREQEERERRQREQREMREREERETREREERENRERMERELEERRETETRVREDRTTEESLSLQETPQWQCEHYQRRCSVKFPCCGVFYSCHRCHNLSGTCPTDDKKAHHATHVKCGNCGHEEEINEGSHTCRRCGIKKSEYFCPKCKHFTGVDKNPFHCEKCEICRIYKDRSFHCDVCNVCLDKRLEGKHKCRPNSGHDECCICLEDAFSGCQILPCSHKVHRECAIAMVQNGVRNCPICRHPLYGQLQQ